MSVCSTGEISTSKPKINKQDLYNPLPTPSRPWESISMNYMSGPPSTKHGKDSVFMFVDKLSKMAILVAWKKSISMEIIAKLFFE